MSDSKAQQQQPRNPVVAYGVKPILGGAVTGGALQYLYSDYLMQVPYVGEPMNVGTVGFVAGSLASYLSEKIHSYINSDQPGAGKGSKSSEIKGALIAAASNAALVAGLVNISNGAVADQIGKGKLAALGFGSEIVASFIQEWIEKYEQSMPGGPPQSGFDYYVSGYL